MFAAPIAAQNLHSQVSRQNQSQISVQHLDDSSKELQSNTDNCSNTVSQANVDKNNNHGNGLPVTTNTICQDQNQQPNVNQQQQHHRTNHSYSNQYQQRNLHHYHQQNQHQHQHQQLRELSSNDLNFLENDTNDTSEQNENGNLANNCVGDLDTILNKLHDSDNQLLLDNPNQLLNCK